jgi:hypothetical protein
MTHLNPVETHFSHIVFVRKSSSLCPISNGFFIFFVLDLEHKEYGLCAFMPPNLSTGRWAQRN